MFYSLSIASSYIRTGLNFPFENIHGVFGHENWVDNFSEFLHRNETSEFQIVQFLLIYNTEYKNSKAKFQSFSRAIPLWCFPLGLNWFEFILPGWFLQIFFFFEIISKAHVPISYWEVIGKKNREDIGPGLHYPISIVIHTKSWERQ